MDKIFTTENLKSIGMIGLLGIILVTGFHGDWVWGSYYTEAKADRDEWKKVALEGLRVSKEVSPVRLPILASAPRPGGVIKPSDVAEQLSVVENFNK